jgi:cytochrome c-type biogenesis protein CcmE
VAEGVLEAGGHFRADTVLAKHDETYMPPEVAKALKEQGVWQGSAKTAAPGSKKP